MRELSQKKKRYYKSTRLHKFATWYEIKISEHLEEHLGLTLVQLRNQLDHGDFTITWEDNGNLFVNFIFVNHIQDPSKEKVQTEELIIPIPLPRVWSSIFYCASQVVKGLIRLGITLDAQNIVYLKSKNYELPFLDLAPQK